MWGQFFEGCPSLSFGVSFVVGHGLQRGLRLDRLDLGGELGEALRTSVEQWSPVTALDLARRSAPAPGAGNGRRQAPAAASARRMATNGPCSASIRVFLMSISARRSSTGASWAFVAEARR